MFILFLLKSTDEDCLASTKTHISILAAKLFGSNVSKNGKCYDIKQKNLKTNQTKHVKTLNKKIPSLLFFFLKTLILTSFHLFIFGFHRSKDKNCYHIDIEFNHQTSSGRQRRHNACVSSSIIL